MARYILKTLKINKHVVLIIFAYVLKLNAYLFTYNINPYNYISLEYNL